MTFFIPGIDCILWFFPIGSCTACLYQLSHCIILIKCFISQRICHFCKIAIWSVFITGNISLFIFCFRYTSKCIIGKICHTSCRVFNGYDAVKAVIAVTVAFPRRGGTPCEVSLGIIAVVLPCTVRVAHTLQPSAFFISVDGAAPVRMADAFCLSHLIIEYTGGGTCRIRDTGPSP